MMEEASISPYPRATYKRRNTMTFAVVVGVNILKPFVFGLESSPSFRR